MPTPYANTALQLRNTELPVIREAVVMATAKHLNIAPRALTFGPRAQLLKAGDHRLTLRGDQLNRTAGFFELEDEWIAPGGKRKAVWRVAQSPVPDSPVEVQFVGTVSGDPAAERRANWAFVRELFAQWQERYPFRDLLDQPMPINEKLKSRNQIERLVERAMDPERRHALVLISPTFNDNTYPVSHHRLNAWLAGHVTVVRVEQEATRQLSDALGGQDYGCFNGSLRVLQPDYQARKRTVYNPLFLHKDLLAFTQDGTLEDRLFWAIQVKGQQAMRFRRPQAAYNRVNELLRQQYTLLDQSENGPDLTKLELRVSLKDAQAVNDALRARIDELENTVATLRTDQQPERLPLDERLRRRFADNPHVALWKTALDAAAVVGPDQYVAQSVDRAFSALDAYAAALSANEQFILGSDIYHFFKNRGIAYHYTDSPSTMGVYGDKRRFTQAGVTREVTAHFTLNSNTDRCVQIYFESDPEARVLRIVYVGKHLPTAEGQHNN